MAARHLPAALAALLSVAALHCGARSQLDASSDQVAATGGAGDTAATTGSGGDGGTVVPEPPCFLEVTGSPVEAIDVPGSVGSPAVIAIPPASPDGPSHVAVQALVILPSHPVNEITRWRLSEDWPIGAVLEEPPSVFGIESHSWGPTAPTPGGDGLAMIWFSDPNLEGRVAFRRLDFASWQGGANVDLSLEGAGPLGLASGFIERMQAGLVLATSNNGTIEVVYIPPG